jgi:multidrug efflux system outer membrane protein
VAVVRRDALQARRQLVRVKLARFQATVGLIRALGGGWGEFATDRPTHPL